MSYLTQNEISASPAMRNRIAQAAAQEGLSSDPDSWTFNFRRTWSSAPGWSDAWESYQVGNPGVADPGANEAVITDGMILAQVQAMKPPVEPQE
jgi:hypothetical protein